MKNGTVKLLDEHSRHFKTPLYILEIIEHVIYPILLLSYKLFQKFMSEWSTVLIDIASSDFISHIISALAMHFFLLAYPLSSVV